MKPPVEFMVLWPLVPSTSGSDTPLMVALRQVRYKDWMFSAVGQGGGLSFLSVKLPTAIHSDHYYDPLHQVQVLIEHQFPIPAQVVAWSVDECVDWIFSFCVIGVEAHEAAEVFCQGDRRPFYPEHGSAERSAYDISRKPLELQRPLAPSVVRHG